MPNFIRGDVLLTQFPFSDLSGAKLRPCVVVSPGVIAGDLIVAAISSVTRSPVSTDILIDASHPEFAQTKLRVASLIRLHKLVALEQSVISRRLGSIGPLLQEKVDESLRAALGL